MNQLEKCPHPFLKERETRLLREKLQKEMKKYGLGYLLLAKESNVFYATGYDPLVGTALAVVPAEGPVHLVISTLESADAYAATNEVEVHEFLSWVFIDDGSEQSRRDKGDVMDPDAPFKLAADIIRKAPIDGAVGIEMGSVSLHMYELLKAELPKAHLVDGSSAVRDARIIKTPWEVKMLRLAAQQLDTAWKHVAADIKPGMPAWKLDALFVHYASMLNLEHGTMSRMQRFIPAVGPYYGLSGVPRGYVLKKGDVVKFDVGFAYFGYHSDIARTLAVGGDCEDKVQELFDVLYRANRIGVQMLKPGVFMRDIYQTVREEVEKSSILPRYPRGHVGHSIGCGDGPEEYPTISPTSTYTLQENMVVCLETPYSGTGNAPVHGGFNLEDTHWITEKGHESFTEMPDSLFWY